MAAVPEARVFWEARVFKEVSLGVCAGGLGYKCRDVRMSRLISPKRVGRTMPRVATWRRTTIASTRPVAEPTDQTPPPPTLEQASAANLVLSPAAALNWNETLFRDYMHTEAWVISAGAVCRTRSLALTLCSVPVPLPLQHSLKKRTHPSGSDRTKSCSTLRTQAPINPCTRPAPMLPLSVLNPPDATPPRALTLRLRQETLAQLRQMAQQKQKATLVVRNGQFVCTTKSPSRDFLLPGFRSYFFTLEA